MTAAKNSGSGVSVNAARRNGKATPARNAAVMGNRTYHRETSIRAWARCQEIAIMPVMTVTFPRNTRGVSTSPSSVTAMSPAQKGWVARRGPVRAAPIICMPW